MPASRWVTAIAAASSLTPAATLSPSTRIGPCLAWFCRPTPQLRANFNADFMYADNSFTRISPRQLQHYRMRTAYNPHPWLSFNGTINILESRDNVETVNHLFHNRDFSFATVITPSEKWSINLNYAYDDIFSTTLECYTSHAGCRGHATKARQSASRRACPCKATVITASRRNTAPSDLYSPR